VLTPRSGRIVAARKLLRRSARREQGLVLLEGPSAVGAAADAGLIQELYVTADAAERHADLVERIEAAGVRPWFVAPEAAAALSETVTPQGIVAIVPLPQVSLQHALERPALRPAARLVVVLAEARDPGNAGTVIRTADAAGADCVVLAGASVDPWSGKCVRASAGSLLHLPVVDGVGVEETITAVRAAGCRALAADGHAEAGLYDLAVTDVLRGDHAWVFGNEAHGLSSDVLRTVDSAVSVPVYGRAESLNLASAAAVCLYESARVAGGPSGRGWDT
jgi:RNA methyltransferase, TrmH family